MEFKQNLKNKPKPDEAFEDMEKLKEEIKNFTKSTSLLNDSKSLSITDKNYQKKTISELESDLFMNNNFESHLSYIQNSSNLYNFLLTQI
jgi:hypothetical protein